VEIERVRDLAAADSGWRKRALLGSVYACSLAAVMALASVSAEAKAKHEPAAKPAEQASKGPFGDAPKGAVEIFVSIDQQKLHLYSDGVHVADTSVATGVPSLPTPLGVFSVIQKQIFHRSNIYSGAPMPFMQRITWSGVALHEGESIGHRASHGCIRMPREFAQRLYQFTKIGARVVVANEELRPAEFADPHLFVHKIPAPTPPAAPAIAATPAPASSDSKSASVAEAVKPEAQEPAKATSSVDEARPTEAAAAPKADAPAVAQSTDTVASQDTAKAALSGDNVKATNDSEPKADAPVTAQSSQSSEPERATPTPVADIAKESETNGEAKAANAGGASKLEVVASAPSSESTSTPVALTTPAPAVVQPPRDSLRGTDASPTLVVDASNGIVPLPASKPADAIQAPADKKTPIAIFISRKTQRIYVRQNFEPIFDAAITLDHPEQPIGTHVFTAMAYLNDGSTFRWDVVSMPGVQPKAKRAQPKEIITYDRYGRPRHQEVAEKPAVDPPAPQTPAEALARIQIPQDIIDRISAMILPGSSLIVSDQGLGEETGEGTDFVVVTSKS
jgi:hypothetical protein